MTSEYFEDFEFEFTTLRDKVELTFREEMPRMQGDELQLAVRRIETDLTSLNRYVSDMKGELRNIPSAYRPKLARKCEKFSGEVNDLRNQLRNYQGRDSADGSDYGAIDPRQRLLRSHDTVNRTSERLENSHRIALESESIGVGVLNELSTQRETIIRTRDHLGDTDQNLGRSGRILRTMSRRVVTDRAIVASIIMVLILILAMIVYIKFLR
eukprot:Nk52_evm20s265 gene=Nk52_evmTU20s265